MKGKSYQAETANIEILADSLTPLDKRIEQFKENAENPGRANTIRFVLNDADGYIEEINNEKWYFIRMLKPEEFLTLKKLYEVKDL